MGCDLQYIMTDVGIMVAQKRAYWFNISSLSYKEKILLLDVLVDPKDLFGPSAASMQQHCKEKKGEGEAALPTGPHQTYAQVASLQSLLGSQNAPW